MSWPATSRYQLDAAPGSLAFVQDFVNTIPAGKPRGPDLLADLPDAQRWLDEALAQWRHTRGLTADDVVLNEADLVELRAIRAGLVSRIRAGTTDPGAPDDDHLALSAPPRCSSTPTAGSTPFRTARAGDTSPPRC